MDTNLPASKKRDTLSLNGTWNIADSVSADGMPTVFDQTVPVPGLVSLATPAFRDAGKFVSRDLANHPLYQDPNLPPEAKTAPIGVSLQERNYFWYQRDFRAPTERQTAILRIAKAQIGTAVWLNGRAVGEHEGCSARCEHHAPPVLRGCPLRVTPMAGGLGPQAAGRHPKGNALEQLPLLYRTGAGSLAGHRR